MRSRNSFNRILWAGLILALFALGACETAKKEKPSTPSEPSLSNPSSLNLQAPGVYWARFDTTKGSFVIKVTRDWAPIGADRFYNLVKSGFYTNASFFRVIPGFIVQFGISADPNVSAVWHDANIQDDPVKQANVAGTVTFATAGPGTRTTQVFINLADNKSLDAQGFSAFGAVTEGMSVAQSFYSGYGEGAPMGSGPNQELIQSQGETYLAANFPKLDHIKSATILQSAP
ncbi:MAG: peptidylprolyl isomerase [Acidobacteria bacterium]|nr:MAG: peptidylprolyl isomerase [Acidobacteriota bacterium]